MKKSLSFSLMAGILLFATACSQGTRIVADKNYITKEVNVGDFHGINISGSADVIYTQANTQKVEIYASQNIVDLIQPSVENGVLVIKLKKNVWIQNSGKLEVRVSNPEINSLSINGSGDAYLTNGVKTQKDFTLYINGSGDINGKAISCQNLDISINGSGDVGVEQITSQECAVSINGSGDVHLSGSTQTAEFNVSGSGDIDAGNLKAVNAKAVIQGSGDISCYATGKLIARKGGSGDISYRGTPQEIDYPKK